MISRADASPFQIEVHPESHRVDVRSVLLLAGNLAAGDLRSTLQRHLLDLPLNRHETLLGSWQQHVRSLKRSVAIPPAGALRVLVDQGAALLPRLEEMQSECLIQRDRHPYRGSGGALYDACEGFDENEFVLISSAAMLLLEPLPELVRSLAAVQADVALIGQEDQSCSLMLARCGALRKIPSQGYVDLKEQALPIIARSHTVRVVRMGKSIAIPIRTLADYIRVIKVSADCRSSVESGIWGEDWQSNCSIIEDGSTVSPRSRMRDSVILSGAVVEDDALIIGSVVCEGAHIRRNETVVNKVVARTGPALRRPQ